VLHYKSSGTPDSGGKNIQKKTGEKSNKDGQSRKDYMPHWVAGEKYERDPWP